MTCSICLDIIKKETEIKTNCGHIFHKECLIECIDYKINSEEYYDNKLECPNCRENIENIDDNNIMEKLEKLNNKQITPNINILGIHSPIINMYSILSRVVNTNYIIPIRPILRPRIISSDIPTSNPYQMRIINDIEYTSNYYVNRRPSIYISRPPISRVIPGNMLIERRNYRLVTRYRNNNNNKKILKEIQNNYNTIDNIKMNKKKNKYNNKKNNKKFNNNYKYNNYKSKNYKILC